MSLLKVVAHITNLKFENNLADGAIDAIVAFKKEICPNNNDKVGKIATRLRSCLRVLNCRIENRSLTKQLYAILEG